MYCLLIQKTTLSAEAEANKVVTELNFNSGDRVEARSDEEGFEGAWFPATVVEKTANGKYLIEYQTLKNDDDTGLLREEVNELHLRPCPPDVGLVDRFELNEEVDAFYNDCWWVGAISKVLKKERYSVYFQESGEELKFDHSDLRVHQEWRDGQWHIASKVLLCSNCD